MGKAIVVGAKDRETNRVSAAVVGNTDAKTLQCFVGKRAANGATVYTDDHGGYQGIGLPPFYVPVPMLVLARFLGRADPAVAHQ